MKLSVGLAIVVLIGVAMSAEYELVTRTASWALVVPRTLVLWAVAGVLTAIAAWLTVRRDGALVKLARRLILVAAITIVPVPARAQTGTHDLGRYREFQLGMTLTALTQQAGGTMGMRTTHQRPALIQELRWSPPSPLGARPDDEAVREVLFTFYDGVLYRMRIEYDRRRTEGLTVDDIVQALSVQYGPASRPRQPIMASLSQGSYLGDEVLATWGDPRVAVTLFRPSYLVSYGLVLTERRLDSLARRASAEASRLDRQEAPQRERDQETAQREETRVKLEQARETNRGTFRP